VTLYIERKKRFLEKGNKSIQFSKLNDYLPHKQSYLSNPINMWKKRIYCEVWLGIAIVYICFFPIPSLAVCVRWTFSINYLLTSSSKSSATTLSLLSLSQMQIGTTFFPNNVVWIRVCCGNTKWIIMARRSHWWHKGWSLSGSSHQSFWIITFDNQREAIRVFIYK